MNNKERKLIQREYSNKNIEFFFSLLESRFRPEFDKRYILEIENLSKSFNIRLKREQKLKFCKKCKCFLNSESREIRLNPKNSCVEHICKNCGFVRRFRYR